MPFCCGRGRRNITVSSCSETIFEQRRATGSLSARAKAQRSSSVCTGGLAARGTYPSLPPAQFLKLLEPLPPQRNKPQALRMLQRPMRQGLDNFRVPPKKVVRDERAHHAAIDRIALEAG